MTAARWTHGDAALGRRVEAAITAPDAIPLRDGPSRALWRVRGPGLDVAVKRFRVGSGRHALRERMKAAIGRAPALREWQALEAMRAAAVAVPAPLALGTLPDGDRLLVTAWIDGSALETALAAQATERARIVAALGAAVRRVHAAGFVHGDLHAGNLVVREGAPVLLDWQHARRTRARSARARDLARLEFALAPLVSRGRRLRLRRIVLGGDVSDDALRAAGHAADRRAREHARSRTRDACRPGRVAVRVSAGDARGLALREVADEDLGALLAAHEAALRAGDARVLGAGARARVTAQQLAGGPVVVKEAPYRGLARALADLVRGSAAARAWRGGHGLRARGIGAARPLARLERRSFGVPTGSWIVLEDLRPAPVAAFAASEGPQRVLDALAALAIRLHRAGIDHGDLKATHVFLARDGERLAPRLIDLEGVRFRRRLADARRGRALAQLNASLPDAFPAAARCAAFARYATALPFERDAASVRRDVARASVARAHRWSGAGCADAR
jgi:tRNA A-37 threonylcarbamoyl transferase component Bud32